MRLRDTGSLSVVCGMPSVSSALRVRPAASTRGKRSRRSAVPVLRGGQTSRYVVDSVLPETASQQQTYQTLVAPLVDSFVQGENVVLLAYGASATGKSYTLQGGTDMGSLSTSGDDTGMVLRATHAILRVLSIVPKAKYCLSVAYCGLSVGHDAQLLDLLAPAPTSAAVSLRDGSAAAALAGLTAWSVEDPCDVLEALRSRRLLQSSGGTGAAKGSFSKRSSMHTMLTLQLDSYEADGTPLQRNTLSFVELAAPEPKDPVNGGRSSGTESAGARSLAVAYSTLSKVLSALRNTSAGAGAPGQQQPGGSSSAAQQQQQQQLLQHVPWRDSPLTRWLQEQLHAANDILVLGTVSTEIEAATDCLTTVSWVSRFSAASRSGADGVIASFAWEALADPEAGPGSYIRFHPDPHELPCEATRQQAATAHGSYMPDHCSAMCSSPMAKLGSPNLQFCKSAGSPRSTNRPRSAGSVCQLGGARWAGPEQQQQQVQQPQVVRRPESPLRGSQNLHPWHREQLQMQGSKQQQQQQQQQGLRTSAGVPSPLQQAGGLEQRGAASRVSAGAGGAGVDAATSSGAPQSPRHARVAAGEAEMEVASSAAQQHAHQQDADDQQQHQQQQGGGVQDDDVLLYGELMSALRRGGGSLRLEAILEQLLQELGAARAALSSERGEGRAVRARLDSLKEQHFGCADSKKMLQEQVVELQRELDASSKKLAEVSADRDLFLRRLQQLELEGRDGPEGGAGSSGSGSSALDMQRQKAHAAQLRMMEAELNALSSSNQQLRSQLELNAQQLSAAGREKLAAADAAAEAASRVQQKLAMAQQEIDMLRSAAEIEAAVRKEMEASADELRRALDATADELASLTSERARREQQHAQAQESIDALVAELQETLVRLEQEQQQVAQLSDKLESTVAEHSGMQKQLSAAQDQASTLQALVQQLEQENASLERDLAAQKRDLSAVVEEQQAAADKMGRLLQDLQLVFADFELDLEAALPQHWQQLTQGSASEASCVSPHSIKLRSRLLSLLSARKGRGGGNSGNSSSRGGAIAANGSCQGSPRHQGRSQGANSSSGGGGGDGVDPVLPSSWAGKLQAVVEVLELAGQERGHTLGEWEAAQQRVQLLETNVQELQKLVSTQESLQQQLATQVDTNSAKAQSQQQEMQQMAADLKQAQAQLQEAQAAVAAVSEELQASQVALKAAETCNRRSEVAVSDRDTALDALADELVAVSSACDAHAAAREQAEEQVVALATELEEALLQLCTREQLLEQIWSQLRGNAAASLPSATTPAAGGAAARDPKGAVASALSRTEELQRLRQQQKQRWVLAGPRSAGGAAAGSQGGGILAASGQKTAPAAGQQQAQALAQGKQQGSVAGLAQRLTSAADNAPAAGIAQQAVAAAMRRSSQSEGGSDKAGSGGGCQAGSAHGAGSTAYRLQQHQQQQAGLLQTTQQQQQQQEEMQTVVVDAVRQLREQVADLQQRLQVAQAGREGCESHLLQQLQQLQGLSSQQQADLAQAQEQKARLQADVAALGQHLLLREQELRQAQLNCQELDAALRELQRQVSHSDAQQQQQQLQHQQQQQQQLQQFLSDPLAPTTPQTAQDRLQEAELQLSDCRKQLSDARSAAAEAAAALAAERAARVAAEDRDAVRQGLLDRLAALQAEVEGLHGALLAERRAVVALRDELTLMSTSRDTWRDAAKRAEVKLREAQGVAEQQRTELTRARAEVLQLRQELAESTQQLLLIGQAQGAEAAQRQRSGAGGAAPAGCLLEGPSGASSEGGGGLSQEVQETLAARLATAQVLKREAEDRAAELSRKLATAQGRLAEMQQQADDSEADMGSQLYQAQAQLVRAKADLAASKAAAAVAAVARSSEGVPSSSSTLLTHAQPQPQQQMEEGGGSQGGDRQRSVAAQLEAAEQLVRSMRATAAVALTESAAAAAAAAPSASMLSTGATPAPQQPQQQHGGFGSRYQSPAEEGVCMTSPFKAASGAGAAGSLDQHLQQYQQQQEAGRAGGVRGSSSDSKPSSPRGGWLYQELLASKEQSKASTVDFGRGSPTAAAAGGGAGLKAAQQGSGVWGQAQAASGDGAVGAEAPCLY